MKSLQRRCTTGLLMGSLMAVAAFSSAQTASPAAAGGATATAKLEPTKGNSTAGSVTFRQEGTSVRVSANVTGLKPETEHGFHVHEKGDCSCGDGMSAGGHFNPDGKPHGPPAGPHHAGDMPSLKSDKQGVAKADFMLTGVTVAPGPTSVASRGLIVHEKADDYKTQPTGDAGGRLACGVITAK